MLIVGLIVLGLEGLSRMPWDLNPDIDIPVVSVTVPYPGAGPEEIEQRILRPLEDAASVINGVDTVSAVAYENMGNVTIQFDYEVDIDVGASDVRDAIDRARVSFPDDAGEPSLYKIDIGAFPILVVGITGEREPRDLRKIVDDQIKPRLGQVLGVASVTVTGGEQREIHILAHKDRLNAVGLSISHLAQALRAENLDVPGGSVKEGTRDYAVRVLGEFEALDEIRNIRIATPSGGKVPLWTIADVQDTVREPTRYARVDGQPTVRVGIIKQSGANTVKVVKGVRAELAELVGDLEGEQGTGELPADIRVVVAQDDSEQVIEAIHDVRDALVFGALLAALVVFLFLHNFRGTIIVALAIPTSMLATFLPIGTGFGFTLNTMVMLALALCVGILVDDSIVVLENIDRHLRRGEQPEAAAYNGRTEIGGAAVSITMVDVVVFVPVALMGGIVGRFFFCFGITAATCTLFSLLMSFTLTPMLASWWYRRRDKGEAATGGVAHAFFGTWDRLYAWLERRYAAALRPAIRHPYITLIIGYGLLTLVAVSVKLGFEFFPASDAGLVGITVETAVGTRIEETDRVIREIENRLLDSSRYPEIEHVATIVGSQGGGVLGGSSAGGQYGQINITMFRKRQRVSAGQRSDEELARDLRGDFADLPSVILKASTASGMHGPGGADIELNILCEDQETLQQAAADLMRRVSQIPGLLYVDLSAKAGRPEIHAQIDRLRASDLGLSVAQIGMAVRTAIEGDTSAKFREAGDEYNVRIQLAEFDRQSVQDVADLFVGVTQEGQPVRLRDVADVFLSTGPSHIERHNRQRKVSLSAALDASIIKSGAAQQAVEAILKEWHFPGVATDWAGTIKMQRESFGFLLQAIGLAIVLVYIVVAALYNSVLQPLIVLLTIPMALVGAMLGLWITGNTLSIVAMIGFIMLIGLVGKNAILVVDYANTLRARGYSRTDALLEAGPTRMKPVLMTTLATIMGMLPTALAINEGSEWRAPMAIAVISGLALSMLISLLVVPASYAIFDQIQVFLGRMGRGLVGLVGISKRRRGDGPTEPPPEPMGEGPAPPAPGPEPPVGGAEQPTPASPESGNSWLDDVSERSAGESTDAESSEDGDAPADASGSDEARGRPDLSRGGRRAGGRQAGPQVRRQSSLMALPRSLRRARAARDSNYR